MNRIIACAAHNKPRTHSELRLKNGKNETKKQKFILYTHTKHALSSDDLMPGRRERVNVSSRTR